MGHHTLRRVTNITFALLIAVLSINLSGVLSLQNALADSVPTFSDPCDTVNDTYSIPAAAGSIKYYTVNNSLVEIENGQTNQPGTGTVTITAHKNNGDLTNTAGNPWSHTFDTAACTTPTPSPSPSTSPAGNNGTLKVHEKDTASDTENNDPKVCVFNFEGFDFDENQSGLIKIEPQGGDSDTSDTAELPFGPANASGYAETTYLNDGVGDNLDNGHYKSTLYGKDANGNYTIDLKAKSKVFKVECEEVELTTVIPTDPQFNEQCGTENDGYTIPTMEGVVYKVDGVIVDAGFHNVSGSVTIIAEATENYVLDNEADNSWSNEFSDASCEHITASGLCQQNGVEVTLTNDGDTDGYAWVNGDKVDVPANDIVSVTIPFTLFKATVTVYGNTDNTLLNKDFDCTPGRGSIGGDEPQSPTVPVVPVLPTGLELPETGANPLVQAITLLIAGVTTYGLIFYLMNRREFATKK
jgi:hypothetical protein